MSAEPSQVAWDIAAEAMRPLVLDRDGKPVRVGAEVVRPGEDRIIAVVRLTQQRGVHDVRHGRRGEHSVAATEVVTIKRCTGCGGIGGCRPWNGRYYDPEGDETCDLCEGSGIEGGWPE